MAALDFPNSPTANQIFTAPDGTQWMWDGVKWVPAGAGAPGTVTSVTAGAGLTGGTITTSGTIALGIPVPVADGGTNATTAPAALTSLGAAPIMGVTNGSNAAAGQVGEYLSNSNSSPGTGIAANTNANAISLALSPGDWDVSGKINFNAASTTAWSWASGFISVDGATLISPSGFFISGNFATGTPIQMPVGHCRISVSVATTVYVSCNANFSGGAMSIYGFIQARRMR